MKALPVCLVLFLARTIGAQHPANANSVYQQLRNLLPTGDVATINHLELRRDAATFTFNQGEIAFYGAVNGKITGAVFRGQGHFHLTPATAEERHNLAILNQQEEFDEDFDEVVLRFTDKTAVELRKAATGQGGDAKLLVQAAAAFHTFQRTQLFENIDLRLLEDVLSPSDGGYFFAAIHGKKDPHLIFTLDPDGAPAVSPEEVSLLSWTTWGETYVAAFPLQSEVQGGKASGRRNSGPYRVDHEDLDTSIEKNGFLSGIATVHLVAQQDGISVVGLALFPSLRVSDVQSEKGDVLDYVQEKREEDADFGVILPHPLKNGEATSIRITYAGKDVVENEGGANYYPVARTSWYPNAAHGLGDYATYSMLFHVRKGLEVIATGTKVKENSDDGITTSEWKTEVPVAVVGFNLGKFAMKEATVPARFGENLTIDAYANIIAPDQYQGMSSASFGNVDTPAMLPVVLSQSQVASEIYSRYFGPIPFTRVAVTQQYACNYGQSWPMLVYLPICGFLDSTQKYYMRLNPQDMYWKVVTPHEVAHQWWGQTVGFRSYRDQWMSEGFADASAAMFLQITNTKPDEVREFWKEQQRLITEKNAQGFRPIDIGPITMGFRLATQKTGWDVYQNLVYPKGAYILHMIRMMMWQQKTGDADFIAMMHDFLSTYQLQAATTEDFKAIVEKHMTPEMDLEQNHRMDWFFRQYVYGTDLPTYHLETELTPNGNALTLHLKLTQSGVPPNFKGLVPLYLEFSDGHIFRIGSASITGNASVERTVQFPKPASPIKKIWINYFYDVLCLEN